MKRSGPLKRTAGLARRTALRSRPRPSSRGSRRSAQRWRNRVLARAGYRCELCGATGETARLTVHHVVAARILKRERLHEHLWDPANGMALCWEPCHANHESAFARIPHAMLPPSSVLFARQLGLEWTLALYP